MESTKYGTIQRCPNCGEPVTAGHAVCPACGHEYRNIQAVSSMQRLEQKIEAINLAYQDKTQSAAQSFFTAGHNLQKDREMAEAIKAFPIPNTKEDLLEFTLTMEARGKNDKCFPVDYAYWNKYMEALRKAEVLFPDDPQFRPLLEKGKANSKKLSTQSKSMMYMAIGIGALILLAIIIGLLEK